MEWLHLTRSRGCSAGRVAMAQRELIHDLVERSRERVVQVRAGSSLLHVLQQQQLYQPPALHTSTSLPLLPPAPTLALIPKRRNAKTLQGEAADGRKPRRRRGALPRLARDVVQLPEATTSFEQYQHFMASKLYSEETVHLQNRRAALVPKASHLKRLAAVCAAALKEMENESEASVVRESLREKLVRAMGLLRGGCAFANAKSLAPPPPPAYGDIKNAHLAFLEFKRDGVSATKQKRVHPWVLPACHYIAVQVDFRNPSRYDEVTATDDFWLRVDSAALAPRKLLDTHHLCFNRSSDGASDPTGDADEDDDLTSLLSDTSYYLGCPGWLDDGESYAAPQGKTTIADAGATSNTRVTEDTRLQQQKHFSIVAMKALTPSREYYGDDAATREYAVETNEGIMRLARWRFVRYTPRRHEQIGKAEVSDALANEQDVNDAMVNCSTVYLVLSNFALVYDEKHKRGVGVRISSDARVSPTETLKLHRIDHKKDKIGHKHHHHHSNDIANVVQLSACARWQVRILQRTGGINYLQELEIALAEVAGDFRKEDGARVEWLRKKQEKMASNNRRLNARHGMVQDAKRQYDLVVTQSNSKLEQIEQQKGSQAAEYFQRRLKELETVAGSHQPFEILQLKQQELQRVVELPHI
ncbi:unnamed protein product [Phytophthora lilii]|uniref:Unnamed protein product n=1 Tax=Phytophthora lilii TaxID=2077276 RepID=A0A9W6TCI1_9STRA|nr:unnamed protein product [Phytophthora lilii]